MKTKTICNDCEQVFEKKDMFISDYWFYRCKECHDYIKSPIMSHEELSLENFNLARKKISQHWASPIVDISWTFYEKIINENLWK